MNEILNSGDLKVSKVIGMREQAVKRREERVAALEKEAEEIAAKASALAKAAELMLLEAKALSALAATFAGSARDLIAAYGDQYDAETLEDDTGLGIEDQDAEPVGHDHSAVSCSHQALQSGQASAAAGQGDFKDHAGQMMRLPGDGEDRPERSLWIK
ncbi:hypothetical protein LTR53_000634 [Teratosphaeriaceae sp. CCFEE 6253]|nr:hypothetical protein LTR53_000634 [Teratosphaeriaceae sp. CCFEE 6253]